MFCSLAVRKGSPSVHSPQSANTLQVLWHNYSIERQHCYSHIFTAWMIKQTWNQSILARKEEQEKEKLLGVTMGASVLATHAL